MTKREFDAGVKGLFREQEKLGGEFQKTYRVFSRRRNRNGLSMSYYLREDLVPSRRIVK
jgi:hypothetical protein